MSTSAVSGICRDYVTYRDMKSHLPTVDETLRIIAGLRHKLEPNNGNPYPLHNSSFPKDNWHKRHEELKEYATLLYALDGYLQKLLTSGKSTLERLILNQSMRATTFYQSARESDVPVNDSSKNEPDESPFLGKFKSNQIPGIAKKIDSMLPGDMLYIDNMETLSGVTSTDTIFRLAAYTSDSIGLASEDRLVRIATIALFEQLVEASYETIKNAKSQSTTDDETYNNVNVAMTVISLVPKVLALPMLGINDPDSFVKDYARTVHEVTSGLYDTVVEDCIDIKRARKTV